MTDLNCSNLNRLWADLIVEELVRTGVGMFCLAPGSRSAPLATAVADHPSAEAVIHFDERGTAFYALGYGRATRRPAVWITTSGTAVANGMAAVVEASVDGVPLLLITADRPPELRDAGANQTIDQVKLFGDYTRWQFDLPVPDLAVDPAFVLTTVDQAVYRSRRMAAGPVHLNCMFREPLAPDEDGRSYGEYLEPLRRWQSATVPRTRYAAGEMVVHTRDARALWSSLRSVRKGLVVAGRLDTRVQGDAVRWLSDRLGWPLLPDVASQLRLGGPVSGSHVVPFYDVMLSDAQWRGRCRPEAVLYVGGRATSGRLASFLAESDADVYAVVHEGPSRQDPHHRATVHVESDVVAFCHAFIEAMDVAPATDPAWVALWREASHATGRVLVEHLSGSPLSEPAAARAVTRLAPEDSGLFLASSMPVRDADSFAVPDGAGPFVASNRGASGIDGTIASAAGFARGLRAPVTVLTGDLALLHDLNSLALVGASPYPVVIVALNNRGGGIFSFLPIARHTRVFEPFFGTPHALSFEHAARMFNLDYSSVSSTEALEADYARVLRDGHSAVIEVATDREENVRIHRTLEAAVAAAVAG